MGRVFRRLQMPARCTLLFAVADPSRLVESSSEVVESEFDDSSDQGMQDEYEDRDN